MAGVLTIHNADPFLEPERSPMTFEEFLEWEGDGVEGRHWEWVDGKAVPVVSIDVRHSLISVFLITLLGIACKSRQIGVLLFDPFVMRPSGASNGRAPDILVVREEHRGWIERKYLRGPADIVIEIVSPGSAKTDYMTKAAEYRRAGVPEYWIINPIDLHTTFLLLNSDGEYREAELNAEAYFESPGLNGLVIDPAWFQQDPLPEAVAILRQWGILAAA